MLIKIERYFSYPDLKRQTPNGSMKWKELTFTEDNVDECDYLVILDHPKDDFNIKVNKNNIIHMSLEPPNEISMYRQYGNKQAKLIFNQFDIKKNNLLSHGALPWHIDKDYDFLSDVSQSSLLKQNKIVWITSNQRSSKGHIERMNFLDKIKNLPFIELYGRGINPVNDKWEVLKNSKYAIAYENFQNDYNWTEKIIDCYLSYTMPIYFGCNFINNFFPENSYILLDPKDKHIDLFLKEIVTSKKWEENLDALQKSRDLVLNEYQLFPFIYNQIKALESTNGKFASLKKEMVFIKGDDAYFDNYPLDVLINKNVVKIKKKVISRISKF